MKTSLLFIAFCLYINNIDCSPHRNKNENKTESETINMKNFTKTYPKVTTDNSTEIDEKNITAVELLQMASYPIEIVEEAFKTMLYKNDDLRPLIILDTLYTKILPQVEDLFKEDGEKTLLSIILRDVSSLKGLNGANDTHSWDRIQLKLEQFKIKIFKILNDLNIDLFTYDEMNIIEWLRNINYHKHPTYHETFNLTVLFKIVFKKLL